MVDNFPPITCTATRRSDTVELVSAELKGSGRRKAEMVRVLLIESTRLVVLVALLWGLQQQNAEAPQSSADSDELVQTQKQSPGS